MMPRPRRDRDYNPGSRQIWVQMPLQASMFVFEEHYTVLELIIISLTIFLKTVIILSDINIQKTQITGNDCGLVVYWAVIVQILYIPLICT